MENVPKTGEPTLAEKCDILRHEQLCLNEAIKLLVLAELEQTGTIRIQKERIDNLQEQLNALKTLVLNGVERNPDAIAATAATVEKEL